jgi:DNA topoisomerase III
VKVCIAEKPSVAREIASVLGANTRRDGYYEGNGYAVTYTITNHIGKVGILITYLYYQKNLKQKSRVILEYKSNSKLLNNYLIKLSWLLIVVMLDKKEN